ncbi:MGMT family protein [Aestuariicella hydrocarbonica]|uniref:MGMT family protein n=1 Tax=Pseudomaricurvus hydrocarbonicus TaxID=1470433 RepID=A0A9E5T1L2_9GAMM|nr:MGMT family protein [Aestuariicella hydrocarbonica]NHO67560.1 MGMT family protein [Aestuariicella hydrocarbonica]
MAPFSQAVVRLIRAIPVGAVSTYGDIATAAGSPRAARQVVRLLHALSAKHQLPWHRVINKSGQIALTNAAAFEVQKQKLLAEGVEVTDAGRVDLGHYRWMPPVGE